MITISTTTNPVIATLNATSNVLDIQSLHGNNFRNTNMSAAHIIQYSATPNTSGVCVVSIQGSFDNSTWVTLKNINTIVAGAVSAANAGTVTLYPYMRLLISTASGQAGDSSVTAKLNIAY
jgi:hypothetical protein